MAKKADEQQTVVEGAETRVIKRYSNRKLYDTKDSKYVTLQQIGEMVRRGEHVQIIDNKTKEDKTEVTLALIISEELKNKPSSVPLGTLRTLIQERGEKLLSQLRESPMGRFMGGEEGEGSPEDSDQAPETMGSAKTPKDDAAPAGDDQAGEDGADPKAQNPAMAKLYEFVESSRQTFDQLEADLEERIRELVPKTNFFNELRSTVETLTQRVEELERKLGLQKGKGKDGEAGEAKAEKGEKGEKGD
ncbi:MAG: polyhydroxyalkanoate synthesis regulator DNA-binding domain-containing protein [Deltaproteobacteria bacterium]|jgi:polyhydroxyalkanoate synthesis repressor PhaR|nr:polyhydroxyalkanoate synthesis regulator DNA-binding domain-containing protein [Deltaproteobacteria bacterium]MBW2535948.1 polyhydroxyalkanoate synthesis regulator DNA-binding domain-containing protein [Deltaproteobacteria bacterium]